MRRLLYIVDWLPPDYGAIGQYALKESEERATAGEDVVLVGLTTGQSGRQTRTLGSGRLTISRLHSSPVDRANFRRRALWTLKTNARLVAHAAPELVSADEILVHCSPPFPSISRPMSRWCEGGCLSDSGLIRSLMNELTPFRLVRSFHAMDARAPPERGCSGGGRGQKRILVSQGVRSERIATSAADHPFVSAPTPSLSSCRRGSGPALLALLGAVAHAA